MMPADNNPFDLIDSDLAWFCGACWEKMQKPSEDEEFRFLKCVARKTADGIHDDQARKEAFAEIYG